VSDYRIPGLKAAFHDELVKAGLTVRRDVADPSATSKAQAEDLISGTAVALHQEVCSPHPVGDAASIQKGRMHLAIEWRLYSRLEQDVVATATTSADYQIDDAVPGGGDVLAIRAIRLNLRQLAASPEIRRALAARP
jgi:hypothetical protein